MFVESDRVQIRMYLGFGALWLQADPRLESAITNVQSIADGGTRPDNSTELLVKSIITKLQGVDASIDALDIAEGALMVDEIKLDTAREDARLRAKGRRYIHRLARIFDTFPRSDIFSAAPELAEMYPNYPSGGRTAY